MSNFIVPELREDVALVSNATKLQTDGIMLIDPTNPKAGRVIFSLQEVPLRINFTTPNNNRLQRVSENRVFIATPDTEQKYKIEIPRTINHTNKDQFLWAQTQSDLCVLSDSKLLANGITIRDQITGETLRISSLKDLPVGKKYFTENDNFLQRKTQNEVCLGDTILLIDGNLQESIPMSDWDANCCGNIDPEVAAILFDGDTPGETLHSSPSAEELVASVAALLMDSKEFPKIISVSIAGSCTHGSQLNIQYKYTGGVEGNSSIRWEKSTEDEPSYIPIKRANSKTYTPTINDIGALVRVAYTPVRADGVTGKIVYSKPVKIKIDPGVKAEVESNLAMSTLMFKVLLRNGNEFQKRSILLNRTKVKVRKRRSTITKMKYSPYMKIIPGAPEMSDLRNSRNIDAGDCFFTLEFSGTDKHIFITPSSYQRDIIVLTIKAFNAVCCL